MPFEAYFLQGMITWHVDPKFQEDFRPPTYIWTLLDLQGDSLKWALKFLLKHTTFHKNFKISLTWIRIFLYILYIFDKSPWCTFEIYHMYAPTDVNKTVKLS